MDPPPDNSIGKLPAEDRLKIAGTSGNVAEKWIELTREPETKVASERETRLERDFTSVRRGIKDCVYEMLWLDKEIAWLKSLRKQRLEEQRAEALRGVDVAELTKQLDGQIDFDKKDNGVNSE